MTDQWYVGRQGHQSGPFGIDALRRMREEAQLAAGDLVWREGLAEWVTVGSVPELAATGSGGTLPPIELDAITRPAPSVGGAWNPYAAPQEDGTAAPAADDERPLEYASFLSRVAAAVLDQVFLALLLLPVGLVGELLATFFGAVADEAAEGLMNLLRIGLDIAYFVGFESSAKQATWGKQLFGLRVADLDGRRVTPGRAVSRYFAKIISALTFGIGFLMPLVSVRRQALHDLIVGTVVVRTRPR